jgi:hypothetical protein
METEFLIMEHKKKKVEQIHTVRKASPVSEACACPAQQDPKLSQVIEDAWKLEKFGLVTAVHP